MVDKLNEDNSMICPMCEGCCMEHIEYKNTHIYICEMCPFMGVEIVEKKDYENMIDWLSKRK